MRYTEYHADKAVIKDKSQISEAMARLAAYEDTGLMPEEIINLNSFDGSQAVKAMMRLQEEQRKHRWISVSERLPDESGYYCVTTEDTETGIRIEQTIWFAHKDDYYIEESEWRELADYEKVIAWRKSDPYNLGN